MFSGVIHSKWVSEGQWLDRGGWQTQLLLWADTFHFGIFLCSFQNTSSASAMESHGHRTLLLGYEQVWGLELCIYVCLGLQPYLSDTPETPWKHHVFWLPYFSPHTRTAQTESQPLRRAQSQPPEIANSTFPTVFEKGPKTNQWVFFLRLKMSTHVWEVYPITGPHSWSLQFPQGDWWMQFCTGTEYLPGTISLRWCWRELGRKRKF